MKMARDVLEVKGWAIPALEDPQPIFQVRQANTKHSFCLLFCHRTTVM